MQRRPPVVVLGYGQLARTLYERFLHLLKIFVPDCVVQNFSEVLVGKIGGVAKVQGVASIVVYNNNPELVCKIHFLLHLFNFNLHRVL